MDSWQNNRHENIRYYSAEKLNDADDGHSPSPLWGGGGIGLLFSSIAPGRPDAAEESKRK